MTLIFILMMMLKKHLKCTFRVAELLENHANFEIACRSCLSGANLVPKTIDAIMSSKSFTELFDLLAKKTPYWS